MLSLFDSGIVSSTVWYRWVSKQFLGIQYLEKSLFVAWLRFLLFWRTKPLCSVGLLCQSTTEFLLYFQLRFLYSMSFLVSVLHHSYTERNREVASLHITRNLRTSSKVHTAANLNWRDFYRSCSSHLLCCLYQSWAKRKSRAYWRKALSGLTLSHCRGNKLF